MSANVKNDFDINIWNRGAWETEGAGPDQWTLCPYQLTENRVDGTISVGDELDHFNIDISDTEVKVLMMGFKSDHYSNFETSDDFWISASQFQEVFTSMPIRISDWIDTVLASL